MLQLTCLFPGCIDVNQCSEESERFGRGRSLALSLPCFRMLQFVVLPGAPAIVVAGSTSVANAAAQTLRHLRPIFIFRCGPEEP